MKRRSNINFNVAGKVSLMGLSLVACATAFPMVSAATYADDDFPVPAAASGSTVGLAFSKATSNDANASVAGTTVSNSVTPLNENNPVRVNVNLAVTTSNVEKYDLYIGSTSADLKTSGCNSDDCKITAMTGTSTFANIPKNKWGYSYSKAANSVNDSYSAVPSTGTRATVIDTKTGTTANGTSNYTLSFAANIGSDRAAGTYSNQVTLSVVSTAKQVTEIQPSNTLTDGMYMQEVTPAACTAAAKDGESGFKQYKLKDARDGKEYYVAKLKDGRCWMTQNLDFDIPAGGLTIDTIEAETENSKKSWKLSDLSAAWNTKPTGSSDASIPATGTGSAKTVFSDDNQGVRSWDPGNYYIKKANPNAQGSGYCAGVESISNCTSGSTNAEFTTSNSDMHYHVGNYYQWCAATAGCKSGTSSGSSLESGKAESSICPAGWTLPTSKSTTENGSFGYLNSLYGNSTDNPTTIASAPLYFIFGGQVIGAAGFYSGFGNSNYPNYGYYWSSTVISASSSYTLHFYYNAVYPSYSSLRYNGYSVRCLLKTS